MPVILHTCLVWFHSPSREGGHTTAPSPKGPTSYYINPSPHLLPHHPTLPLNPCPSLQLGSWMKRSCLQFSIQLNVFIYPAPSLDANSDHSLHERILKRSALCWNARILYEECLFWWRRLHRRREVRWMTISGEFWVVESTDEWVLYSRYCIYGPYRILCYMSCCLCGFCKMVCKEIIILKIAGNK